tara:strand:- start:469 stop:747 length:279 start_codon:yes stop_codon:yes gene_type:complete
MEFFTNNVTLFAGGGASAIALWLLKRIPNDDLYSWVKTGAYWAGTVVTLGLGKWKWTKKIWNKTVEPYFIDLLSNTVEAGVEGFVEGLRSDK